MPPQAPVEIAIGQIACKSKIARERRRDAANSCHKLDIL
jgi:hypothetical protein